MVTRTDRGEWRRPLSGEHEVGLGTLLFVFLGPPVAWTLHFVGIYFLVALYCTTGRTSVTVEVVLATVVAAAVSAGAGVVGHRAWRGLGDERSLLAAATGDLGRSGFLLVMGIAGAILFTLLIVTEGIPPFFVPTCGEGA